MLKNIFETSPLNHDLFPISGKRVELSFTGDQISSDGGLLLFWEAENQLGLVDRVSRCITDNRDQRYTDHSIKEMLVQRVFQIAAGYEDSNDCYDTNNNTYGQQELNLFNYYYHNHCYMPLSGRDLKVL